VIGSVCRPENDRKTTDFIIGSRQIKNNPGKQGLFWSRNGQVFELKETDSRAARQRGMTKTTKRDKTRQKVTCLSKSVLNRELRRQFGTLL
jgi:hypothetical protein